MKKVIRFLDHILLTKMAFHLKYGHSYRFRDVWNEKMLVKVCVHCAYIPY